MQPANLIPLVLILGAFYLLILRPARTRQRQQLELQRQVEPGVEVMTTSGMFGTVTEVDDDAVHLEVAPGIVLRFTKAAIGRVVTAPVEDEADDDLDDDAGVDAEHDGDDLDDDLHPTAHDHDGSAGAPSDVGTPDAPGGSGTTTGPGTGSGRPDEPRDRAAG